jgi:hypothetical protein
LPTVNQSKQIGFKEESKAQTRLTQLKEDNIIFMKRILINTTERREKPRTGSDKKKMNVLVPIPPISFPKSDPGIPHKVEGKV